MLRNEFKKATTLEELKTIYHKLAMENHPDKGGSVEAMKEVNALYEEFFEVLKNTHRNKDGETYTKETNEAPADFMNIIDELLKMGGIKIEIIGSFIWVSGDTKPHKEALKALGFKWHTKKMNWYKAPAGYRKRNNKRYNMNQIRGMFGVQYEAETESAKALTA